jgi:hypothetical protein
VGFTEACPTQPPQQQFSAWYTLAAMRTAFTRPQLLYPELFHFVNFHTTAVALAMMAQIP